MTSKLSKSQLWWVSLAQACALLPVFIALPTGFAIYWFVVAIWRIQIQRKSLNFPGKFVKGAAALTGVLALFFSFTSLLSVETFVAFFLVSYSLKLLELYDKKDGTLILSLSFIALAAGFLFHQGLLVSIFSLLSFCVILQAWMSLYRALERAYFSELKSAALMVLTILPIMVVLFLVMPRAGQLWHMPSQSQVGNTGFSNTMSPGTFSNLIQSNEVAFRVSFDNGQVPLPAQRYWRGLVLDYFDGNRWDSRQQWRGFSRSSLGARRAPDEWSMQYDTTTQSLSYIVLIEPHLQTALFSLMAPASASSSSLSLRFGKDATLLARTPVAARAKYTVNSYFDYQFSPKELSRLDYQINTRIPSTENSRAREWAQQIRSEYGRGADADRAIIQKVLSYFNQRFVYTLHPPLMSQDSVDTFLFDAQRGFCEHFSSSFVFVMRAAGIPARVVVGYQGGEYNAEQDYMVVRQRDAHAWAEVWIDGTGWQRVDPTAAVAPERIESGLSDALNAEEVLLVGGLPSNIRFVNWLRNEIEILNYQWQSAVLNYDDNAQSEFFLRFLGGQQMWRLALFLFVGAGCVLAIYFALLLRTRRTQYLYSESELYERHLRRLAKLGFVKMKSETPIAFAQRVGQSRPEWTESLKEISSLYVRVAFGGESEQLALFRERCRSWRA